MTSDQHAHFVGLSQEWCQLREEFHRAGTSKARKQEIRKRKREVEAEQDLMLQQEKEESDEVRMEQHTGGVPAKATAGAADLPRA
ncbi:hypothetical protein [Pontibacter rugosus]|uniref:Uncharacterized protein n=1 Tax=Pontibacter rugosus TaxID=1745966 RepID=A0ABW3SJ83_9BACT